MWSCSLPEGCHTARQLWQAVICLVTSEVPKRDLGLELKFGSHCGTGGTVCIMGVMGTHECGLRRGF